MNRRISLLGLVCLLTLLSPIAKGQLIRYVKPDNGRILKNGLSWSTAYDQTQLQTAINSLSVTGGQVWVAQGIYKPTIDVGNRYASFSMRNQVAIYGGFPADPNSLLTRSPSQFPTVLSGDIDGDGTLANNSFSVIFNTSYEPVDSTAVLDGFVITGGNADQQGYSSGAGIRNSEYCVPTIANCIITGNAALSVGGGIMNLTTYQYHPRFINCLIANNTAGAGGAMYNVQSSPQLINCIIRDNSATRVGGALYNSMASYPVLINCSLIGNSAPAGGGAAIASFLYCGPKLINSILWNNGGTNAIVNQYYGNYTNGTYDVVLDHCLIEYRESTVKGYIGQNNIETLVSPFESATSEQLLTGSPAIDAGNNEAYSQAYGPLTDYIGHPRIRNGTIDLGAIEYVSVPTNNPLRLVENPVPTGRPVRVLLGDYRPNRLELYGLTGEALLVQTRVSPDGSIWLVGSDYLSPGSYLVSASDGVSRKSIRVVVY